MRACLLSLLVDTKFILRVILDNDRTDVIQCAMRSPIVFWCSRASQVVDVRILIFLPKNRKMTTARLLARTSAQNAPEIMTT